MDYSSRSNPSQSLSIHWRSTSSLPTLLHANLVMAMNSMIPSWQLRVNSRTLFASSLEKVCMPPWLGCNVFSEGHFKYLTFYSSIWVWANIQRPWFGFDKASSNIWSWIFEHLTSITPLPSWATRLRTTFSSIDDFTSKFIEINGNPSILYIIDCTRTHHDTQINEIMKITNRINLFILLRH